MLQEVVKIFMEAKSYKNGGSTNILPRKIPVQNYFLLVTFKKSINLVMEKNISYFEFCTITVSAIAFLILGSD